MNGEKEIITAFELYLADSVGMGMQSLAQMFLDLKLMPTYLSYAQIRAEYQNINSDEDGLNYSSFLQVLPILAQAAFSDIRGDPTDKLIARMRAHLPAPPDRMIEMLVDDQEDSKLEVHTIKETEGQNPINTVSNWIANKIETAAGLEEALCKVQQEAQKRLGKLAEEFAQKQIELQKQREEAEQELEAELQIELIQNTVRSTRQKRSTTRPSTERLNLEEKIAALDRSRACRPSRSVVQDGSAEKLEIERIQLTRRATALKVLLPPFSVYDEVELGCL